MSNLFKFQYFNVFSGIQKPEVLFNTALFMYAIDPNLTALKVRRSVSYCREVLLREMERWAGVSRLQLVPITRSVSRPLAAGDF